MTPTACKDCKHVLKGDVEAFYMIYYVCKASPISKFDSYNGESNIIGYRLCNGINLDGNCKKFEDGDEIDD